MRELLGCLASCTALFAFSFADAPLRAQSGAPTSFSARVHQGNWVTLSWVPPPGRVSFYMIEAGSSPSLADIVNVSTGYPTTEVTTQGVAAGTYYVRVRAVFSDGTVGLPSTEVTVVVNACVTAAPTNFATIAIANSVYLTVDPQPVSAYRLEAGSAPSLANLFDGEFAMINPNVPTATAGSGTYYVRARARTSCGVSAPTADTVLRVGQALGIGFQGVGTVGQAFTSHSEAGFVVQPMTGSWSVGANNGFVQFVRTATQATLTAQLRVTANSLFRFTSVNLYSSITHIPYDIRGVRNGVMLFRMSGVVPNTFGQFATVSGTTGALEIDSLLITLTNPTTECCSNPVGVDNIAVTF